MTQTLGSYLGLVTSWHRGRPNFAAVLTAVLSPVVDAQDSAISVASAFDLETAVGVQLDAIGEWVGRSRSVATPLVGVYFSFDTEGVGFDDGYWLGPFDPIEGLVSLDDASYRQLLRVKIASNHWDGTLESAARSLNLVLNNPGSKLFLEDGQDMTMVAGVSGVVPDAVVRSLLSDGYLPFKPSGVKVSYVVTSVDGSACFGFDASGDYIEGFDTGAWPVAM